MKQATIDVSRNFGQCGVLIVVTSETQLIARVRTDPAAFGELYSAYLDRVYNYIYHRVGNVPDAEDLTARTFHRALVSMPSYVDHGAPFGAWLFRIAHNIVANWHRDRSRHPSVPFEALDTAPGINDGVGDRLAAQTLRAERVAVAIRALEPERQSLLILKFNQGLSNAEIGAVLGRSEGAVKSLYHRTLRDLREQLVDGEWFGLDAEEVE